MRSEGYIDLPDGKVEVIGGEFDGLIALACSCGRSLAVEDDYADLGLVEWPDGTYSLCHIDCLDAVEAYVK